MANKSIDKLISEEFNTLFKFKQTDRRWHVPLLAAICVGVPLMVGLYFNNLQSALIAGISGLVILYLPDANFTTRMTTILLCSFGFMISFTIGICFSFHPLLSAIVFGVLATLIHYINLYLNTKPPGSFFFIMIASFASCMPFDLNSVPTKIGMIGLGTMFACTMALCYSLLVSRKQISTNTIQTKLLIDKNRYSNIVEACIIGFFMFLSMCFGQLLNLHNPYWIPISCLAVLQGVTLYHIWQRGYQRILGTLIGLAFTWMILSYSYTPLHICISIIVLQFIIEFLIVRNYAFAVIFITPMTIFLAEAASPIIQNPNHLIYIRFIDIAIGSSIGAIGGWFIHHEKIRLHATRRIRKTRVFIKRR